MKTPLLSLLVLVVSSVNISSVYSGETKSVELTTESYSGIKYVQDSYLVTLDTSLVLPPNKANKGKIPFGMHSSGQDKAELAKQLGIKDKVISIFDGLSSIHVALTEEDALNLSKDERVLYMQRDTIGGLAVQNNPGWALDRIDEATPMLDNTYNDTPLNIPQAFVVGATSKYRIVNGQDAITSFSRRGTNISIFAPGQDVNAMDHNGNIVTTYGTSFSAPYVAGLFATACQASGAVCQTASSTNDLYVAIRNSGTLNTVTEPNGSSLTTGTTSRFVNKSW